MYNNIALKWYGNVMRDSLQDDISVVSNEERVRCLWRFTHPVGIWGTPLYMDTVV